jgi:hypothetical protein
MVAAGWPAFMGGLSPALGTGLFVPARHAGMSQNIGVDKISAPKDLTSFRHQSISLLTGVLSKSGKNNKRSPSLSDISFSTLDLHLEAITKIFRPFRELSQVG